jgi:hypothetical protein
MSCGCDCNCAGLRRARLAPPAEDRRAPDPLLGRAREVRPDDARRDAVPRLDDVPLAEVLRVRVPLERAPGRDAVPRLAPLPADVRRVVGFVDFVDFADVRPAVLRPRPLLLALARVLVLPPRAAVLRVDVPRLAVDRDREPVLAELRLFDDRVLVARFLAPPPALVLDRDVRLPDDLLAIPPPSVVSASGAASRVCGRSRPECV